MLTSIAVYTYIHVYVKQSLAVITIYLSIMHMQTEVQCPGSLPNSAPLIVHTTTNLGETCVMNEIRSTGDVETDNSFIYRAGFICLLNWIHTLWRIVVQQFSRIYYHGWNKQQ